MFENLWNKLCRKIGLYIVFYKPNGPIRYSKQAILILKEMPNFDYEDFEKWFCEGLSVGGHNITAYLMYKEKKHGTKRK